MFNTYGKPDEEYLSQIEAIVIEGQYLKDLLPILLEINLDDLKQFIIQSLHNMHQQRDIKNILYRVLRIDALFCDDIMQHILSFNSKHDIEPVSKAWKSYASKNKHLNIQQSLQMSGYEFKNKSFYTKQIEYIHFQSTHQSLAQMKEKYKEQTLLIENKKNQIISDMDIISQSLKKFILEQSKSNHNQSEFKQTYPSTFINAFNNTWIVDPYRSELTNEETKSGYKGPIEHPIYAINKAKSGDKILVYPGIYHSHCNGNCFCWRADCNHPHDFEFNIKDKDLQIIGIGDIDNEDNAIIFSDRITSDYTMEIINSNVCLENIIFKRVFNWNDTIMDEDWDCRNWQSFYGTIGVQPNSGLWLKNCKVAFNKCGIQMARNTDVFSLNCVFIGGHEAESGVVTSIYANNVSVCNGMFIHCGNGNTERYDNSKDGDSSCIQIDAQCNLRQEYEMKQRQIKYQFVKLECRGNTFCDNKGYPVCLHYGNINVDTSKVQIESGGNKLKGYNGINTIHKRIDPNRLYTIDSHDNNEY